VEDIQQAGGIITMQVSIFLEKQNKKQVFKKLMYKLFLIFPAKVSVLNAKQHIFLNLHLLISTKNKNT
jgi:hypothetical protein